MRISTMENTSSSAPLRSLCQERDGIPQSTRPIGQRPTANARISRFLALTLFSALLTLNSAKAALSWYTWGGHSFALTLNNGTWAQNEAEAEADGGYLATISSAAENTWLGMTFNENYCLGYAGNAMGAGVDIGYYYNASATAWGWISGAPVTYTWLYYMWPQGGSFAYLHEADHPIGPFQWNCNPWHTVPLPGQDNYAQGIIEVPYVVPGSLAGWVSPGPDWVPSPLPSGEQWVYDSS